MKVMLIGGGSGGHITPLLAVAHELKQLSPGITLVAVCERGSKFSSLYTDCKDIDKLFQIPAGKFRRYGGQSLLRAVTDVKTISQNGRDVFRTLKGYKEARKLLKAQRPDIIVVKGGFVAVPMGLAAAKLKIPYITHDSDSVPGLTNRIIGRWAKLHATGLPAEMYNYPSAKTRYVGIPISKEFIRVGDSEIQEYRKQLGIADARLVITLVGGSQGGDQLNQDMVAISKELNERYQGLIVLHIAGKDNEEKTKVDYKNILGADFQNYVRVIGFTPDIAKFTGVADLVISRASATAVAELAVQVKPVVVVPGQLADSHQEKNAKYLSDKHAALIAKHADKESLLESVVKFIENRELRHNYAKNLSLLAKPNAARDLAELTLESVS